MSVVSPLRACPKPLTLLARLQTRLPIDTDSQLDFLERCSLPLLLYEGLPCCRLSELR